MKAVCCFESSVNLYQTTRRHIPENFHNHRLENFKFAEILPCNFPTEGPFFNVMFLRVTHVSQIIATAFADISL